MSNALRAAGKPVKLEKIPGDDQRLSTSQARIRALTENDTFLRENLPN